MRRIYSDIGLDERREIARWRAADHAIKLWWYLPEHCAKRRPQQALLQVLILVRKAVGWDFGDLAAPRFSRF